MTRPGVTGGSDARDLLREDACSCLWAWLGLWLAFLSLAQAGDLPEFVTLTSSSKQFVVQGLRGAPGVGLAPGNPNLLILDPAMVLVMGERLKSALDQELGLAQGWKGRVFVEIHPIQRDREEIIVASRRNRDGWNYSVALPDEVEAHQLMRVLVAVLLSEYANRGTKEGSVEFPPWLLPGVTAELETGPLATLILERGQITMRDRGAKDALASLRSRLRGRATLTVDRLNWPEPEDTAGGKAEVYDASAQLFVRELLRLPRGRECLHRMLNLLPGYLNWQMAFLRAFEGRFANMIEVEKWWSMVLVQATGEPAQLSPQAAWQQLDQILFTPVQVRLKKNELPHTSYESLQNVVSEWDLPAQQRALRRKVSQLQALQRQAPPTLGLLIEDYRQTLEAHLHDAALTSQGLGERSRTPLPFRAVAADTVRKLTTLDRRRSGLAPMTAAPEPASPPTEIP